MARHRKQTLKQTVAISLIVLALFTGAYAIGEYRARRMDAYADANNCEWYYSWYINEEPICK